MDVLGLHHVALAVADLDGAIDTYERLYGGQLELREHVDHQGVEAAYLRLGAGRVELLAATDPDTPVGRFLERRGEAMHHLALEVEDVGKAIGQLRDSAAELIDEAPRTGLGGHEVAFIQPDSQHGVLIEVVSNGR